MKLDSYLVSRVPPLRTAQVVLGPTSYRHLTPMEWKTINARIHLVPEWNLRVFVKAVRNRFPSLVRNSFR